MKVNASNIKKLYQSVLTVVKRSFSIEDAAVMVLNCPGLKLTDKDATMAFAYSKFLVTDEMDDIMQV